MWTDLLLEMGIRVRVSSFRLTVLGFALWSSTTGVFALPALPPSVNLSPVQVNTSSLMAPPNPPTPRPICPETAQWGATLGRPLYSDCDYILSNLYPQDPLARPVLRNFFTAFSDVSHTLLNVQLPYEQSYSITAPP